MIFGNTETSYYRVVNQMLFLALGLSRCGFGDSQVPDECPWTALFGSCGTTSHATK